MEWANKSQAGSLFSVRNFNVTEALKIYLRDLPPTESWVPFQIQEQHPSFQMENSMQCSDVIAAPVGNLAAALLFAVYLRSRS